MNRGFGACCASTGSTAQLWHQTVELVAYQHWCSHAISVAHVVGASVDSTAATCSTSINEDSDAGQNTTTGFRAGDRSHFPRASSLRVLKATSTISPGSPTCTREV